MCVCVCVHSRTRQDSLTGKTTLGTPQHGKMAGMVTTMSSSTWEAFSWQQDLVTNKSYFNSTIWAFFMALICLASNTLLHNTVLKQSHASPKAGCTIPLKRCYSEFLVIVRGDPEPKLGWVLADGECELCRRNYMHYCSVNMVSSLRWREVNYNVKISICNEIYSRLFHFIQTSSEMFRRPQFEQWTSITWCAGCWEWNRCPIMGPGLG